VKTITVFIGLGSNIEQPREQIKSAISALARLPDTVIIQDAGFFESAPMGPEDQPDYVNTVVECETGLSATALLQQCQQIEQEQGRVKKRHWGERSIDLDILLYGDQQLNLQDLIVPHVGICQRDFVYLPLLKLNEEIEIPGKGLLREIIKMPESAESVYACRYAGRIS
jgi:2-amino-4-hydroxy-6-hydroxymethyldihydropteridine diphosphokinase